MSMNFIAFSSRAKLLDRPHLDAAAAGHLDKIYQADVLQNPPAAGEWLRTPACRSEGPKSTAAMATRGSRPIALGTYLGAGSTQYRLQSYVARRACSSAAMPVQVLDPEQREL